MYEFGDVVLTRFPFTDLSGGKMRPALVVSRDNARRSDLVLAFITSNVRFEDDPDVLLLAPSAANGLKTRSFVRFDKLATLEMGVIVGKLGEAEPEFLLTARPVFHGVFGFGSP
ncbi:MAG: type II toxin-antitoxin system PemK/MazF family toxin [Caulobacteraceae bacterium]